MSAVSTAQPGSRGVARGVRTRPVEVMLTIDNIWRSTQRLSDRHPPGDSGARRKGASVEDGRRNLNQEHGGGVVIGTEKGCP